MKIIAAVIAVALSACAHTPPPPAPGDCDKMEEQLEAAARRATEAHDAGIYERAMREYQECLRKNRRYANPKKAPPST